MEGDTASLCQLLDEDALILDRVRVGPVAENPLHIASLLGHLDFAKEILRRKPELARERNSEGASPLHLASAKGYVELVQELLKVNSDVCFLSDQEGRIPLHIAAVKGHLGVINELINAMPESAHVKTDGGETILHLCLQYNQFEAFKLLLQSVENKDYFLKSKDNRGS
ncbi:PREDICTED: ankyrin-1-like [Nelumbo nucifera]|uniref:Ankyrin-1-like n=1 Tax=Nelumbo nucifera TaxID=4432 RepID=A0A1U8A7N9_NELNU|nr:PREDICTED: ankyrin-1-like [Nelumbo nucifera]